MIGRNAGTDEAVRDRKAVKDVDPNIVTPLFLRGFGCVVPRRARADDRQMAHSEYLLQCSRLICFVPYLRTAYKLLLGRFLIGGLHAKSVTYA